MEIDKNIILKMINVDISCCGVEYIIEDINYLREGGKKLPIKIGLRWKEN